MSRTRTSRVGAEVAFSGVDHPEVGASVQLGRRDEQGHQW
jgi:hypothetical protein